MKVREVIALKGWIDNSGWSYETTYEDRVIEADDINSIDWDWWEVQPKEGEDVKITVSFYSPDADIEKDEPLAVHAAWESELI